MKIRAVTLFASSILLAVPAISVNAEEQGSSVFDEDQDYYDFAEEQDYRYAPKRATVKGEKKLTCVGIKYSNINRHVGKGTCKTIANRVSSFYRRNSRGHLQLKAEGHLLRVPFRGSKKSYRKAVRIVKNNYNSDLWAIPGIFTHNHAGKKVAYLKGSLVSTAVHEVGHLLGLGHSGVYKKKKGKWKLNSYGDGQSAMSGFSSAFLTAPQYYHQGWLPENEAVIWEEGKLYDLKRINDFDGEGLATIIVKHSEFNPHNNDSVSNGGTGKTRDAFISFPIGCRSSCIALHLSSGGGSQRVKLFANEYYDKRFTGLHIKKLGYENGRMRISVDFDEEPEEFADNSLLEWDDSVTQILDIEDADEDADEDEVED